jgi:hypothetical protein
MITRGGDASALRKNNRLRTAALVWEISRLRLLNRRPVIREVSTIPQLYASSFRPECGVTYAG